MPEEPTGSSNVEDNIQSEPSSPESLASEEGVEAVGSHVCDTCVGDNLLKECGIRTCARCLNPFCLHYASKVDPLTYCVSCMSAIELTRSVVTKTYEHFDEVSDTLRTWSRKAREIHLSGDDWMFAQRRINTLSDAELDMVIEYHRQYLQLLCSDQERRRMEKAHRNAGVKFIIPTSTVTTTTVTTSKKTNTVKLDKQKEKTAAMLSSLDPAVLAALVAKLSGK